MLPNGWSESAPFGAVVQGTRFVALKVPLPDTAHNPATVVAANAGRGTQLGMVIDLTNKEYYNGDLFRVLGVQHLRLPVPGHSGPPPEETYATFENAVMRFSEAYPDYYVGVHCTHGHNRTGYMIARFMTRSGVSPMDAVMRFREARPPGIWDRGYIHDIFQRCSQRVPADFEFPPPPSFETKKRDYDGVAKASPSLSDNWVTVDGRTKGGYISGRLFYCRHTSPLGGYDDAGASSGSCRREDERVQQDGVERVDAEKYDVAVAQYLHEQQQPQPPPSLQQQQQVHVIQPQQQVDEGMYDAAPTQYEERQQQKMQEEQEHHPPHHHERVDAEKYDAAVAGYHQQQQQEGGGDGGGRSNNTEQQ